MLFCVNLRYVSRFNHLYYRIHLSNDQELNIRLWQKVLQDPKGGKGALWSGPTNVYVLGLRKLAHKK
jgi:hypothetical protein